MPPITALIHTANDALRLGRTLETLFPCAEILVVDHGSSDQTLRIARGYGAHCLQAEERTVTECIACANNDWTLCLQPSESLTEALQASLYEWSLLSTGTVEMKTFSISVREQIGERWIEHAAHETRLVPRNWTLWKGHIPGPDPSSQVLEGELLRLAFP